MKDRPVLADTEPASILVRGVNWLGDAVMSTPALQRLRERFPRAKITLVTPEKLADLWLHHPAIDDVTTFKPRETVLRLASRIRGWKFMKTAAEFQKGRLSGEHRNVNEAVVRAMQFYSLLGDFKSIPFDVAIILPNSPRSALESWLARIPRRIGYARPWRNWLLTDALPARAGHVQMRKRSKREIQRLISNETPGNTHLSGRSQTKAECGLVAPKSDEGGPVLRSAFDGGGTRKTSAASHQIHEYLHLTAALGANPDPVPPRLELTTAEVKKVETSLLEQVRRKWPHLPSLPLWLALNPSAAYGPAKRWPADRFAAVARQACERSPNAVWIAIGGPKDSPLCEQVIGLANTRILNRAGDSTLRDLMALLKLSRVLLTNDSGPMHVAAALGTSVVVPFGSTSPTLTGPGFPGDAKHHLLASNAPCSPCFLRECPIDFRCMTGISVERVFASVLDALSS